MEEVKIKGIVLNNVDYREKDKIVTLFSLELGLVSMIIKNCRSSSYKLKFAYSPLSFAEFELFKKGEIFTLKTATFIENFYSISQDYEKYIIASNILEILLKTNKQYENTPILFINTLKILNNLCYEDINSNILLLKFLLGTLKVNGFKLNFKYCNTCTNPYVNKIYLNLSSGEFECGSCRENYSVLVEKSVFDLLKNISNCEIENLNAIQTSDLTIKESIKLLSLNIENRFNIKLNTKNFYK